MDTVLVPPRNPNSNPVERQNQSIYAALKVDFLKHMEEVVKKISTKSKL